MKTIEQTYTIDAPIVKVWQTLVDPAVIARWGGGPAVMNGKESTEFKLWGGNTYGRNTEVVLNKLLAQEWFDNDFKQPSTARFELSEKDSLTVLRLVHSSVSDDREKDIAEDWKEYYLGPMKELLES